MKEYIKERTSGGPEKLSLGRKKIKQNRAVQRMGLKTLVLYFQPRVQIQASNPVNCDSA